ncbi:TetR/AcrR family transcriptional regulator [Chondromyces apiculatus]|uniref:Transcriptional regulator, TetR family n=1 Tax=Chondromyces apiculatus DSM 436 TaxID=1192034 RepID=A0A017T8F2_9BACT|nr:TetR/AcrR family transcriptional regulator [Chondromyces apiculatus]EYF05060.1 Transcriptional regulator, TetR family [Chondromyces apiculatus DSM 436]
MRGNRVAETDPTRTLLLLWGSHSKPGRSGLTVRAIVTAAIELADAEGIEAVSMRQVAERLGVGTMALYTYVPGKADLTALMLDTVQGQLYEDVDAPSRQPGGWRGALTFIAERNWEVYQRHPWVLHVAQGRPVLGPNLSLKYEAELRPLDKLGLSDVEMDSALTLVLTHVAGTAGIQAQLAKARQESGMSDGEWWLSSAPVLAKVMDDSRFPVAGRVGSASGTTYEGVLDPRHALTFGLECILDGIAQLIARRQEAARKDEQAGSPRARRGRRGG